MKRLLTLLLLLTVTGNELYAQDPEFSQFYANPLYLNPAMAGTAAGPRFAINYRNQWPSLANSFVTYSASYDEHFDAIGGGVGAQVWRDQAGDGKLSTTYMSAFYSYHLDVSPRNANRDFFVLKFGLQASAFQRSIDFSKLTFGDQINPRLGFVNPTNEKLPSNGTFNTNLTPDVSTGIMGFTKKYYGGIAIHHLIEPTQSFFGNPNSNLPRKLTGHFGMLIPIGRNKRMTENFISPNILIQSQGKFTQFNLGGYFIKNSYMGGLWFRQTASNSDALIMMIGVKKGPLRIGYSYDLTVSGVRSAARGSHEVSLIIEAQKYNKKNKRKWKDLKCPSM